MKKLILLSAVVLVGFSLKTNAQNLVPNPSFEDTIQCPTYSSYLWYANGWDSYGNSPDYFNICATFPTNYSVPANGWGNQNPASGNAYAGFWAYSELNPNGKEFIGRQLQNNLIIGTTYYISLKVSLAEVSNCGVNKIGILFSTIPYSAPITNNPQIFTNTIITDTLGWTNITGFFIADSAYQYIVVGNFFDNANTDTIIIDTPDVFLYRAYYYLDDVCVSTDSLTCNQTVSVNEVKLNPSSFSIYPNPATDYFHINQAFTEPYDLVISNVLGQQLYSEKNIVIASKKINIHNLDKGLLLIHIKTENQSIIYKLLKR